MDTGLLILRIAVGLLLAGHGAQKLFGWFGGYGLDGTSGFFHSLGFRPGKGMAAVAGASEAGGGLLLALGLFTPLAGAVIVGTLLVAASVHLDKGLWSTNGGYELPLLLAVLGAVAAFTGPGAYSLDNAFGLVDEWNSAIGLVAVLVGVGSAGLTMARARGALRADQAVQDAGNGEAPRAVAA